MRVGRSPPLDISRGRRRNAWWGGPSNERGVIGPGSGSIATAIQTRGVSGGVRYTRRTMDILDTTPTSTTGRGGIFMSNTTDGGDGVLASQGVRLGLVTAGERSGCYLLLTDLFEEGRSDPTAWLLEYSGEDCRLEEHEFTADSPAELAEVLAGQPIEWYPDDEDSLLVVERYFPRRLGRRRGVLRWPFLKRGG